MKTMQEKVKNLYKKFVYPHLFHGDKQRYIRDISIISATVIAVIFFVGYKSEAATYNFVQASWAGGLTANNAGHTSNRTGWTQYASSTGVTANSTVSLALTEVSAVDGNALVPLATPTISTGGGPRGVAVSPDGLHTYVANNVGNTILMYSRNTSTGALTALATPTIAAGSNPYGIVVSPDGTSVYVTNNGGTTISMYSRNASTGALTALATPTIAAGTNPRGIVISADGTSVYTVNTGSNTVSMYSRNVSTGALTALATPTIATGSGPYQLAISPDGTSVYVPNVNASTLSMYSRNTSTGALTALATPTITTGTTPMGVSVSPNGASVYVLNYSAATISMYSRNTSTGALTALATPTVAAGTNPYSVNSSSDGTRVYVVNYGGSSLYVYNRNTTTGVLTLLTIPTIPMGANPSESGISADGSSLYVSTPSGNIYMYRRPIAGGATGFEYGTHSSTILSSSGITLSNLGALTALATPTISSGSTPEGVTVSPDGASAYAVNSGSNNVSMYSRNISTGALTALATPTIASGFSPQKAAISPDGTSVYVTNASSNTISMYSRNVSTGALTALATPTIAAGTNLRDIVVSSDGISVYAVSLGNSTVYMYSRNTSTGALTALATPTIAAVASPMGVAISSDGTSVYVTNSGTPYGLSMYSRNTSTGALTALATPTISTGVYPTEVKVSGDGLSVYVTNGQSSTVSMYSRNTGTGALTALATPTIAAGSTPAGLVISADGLSVYVTNQNGDSISMYSRNTSTGALTALPVSTIATGSLPRSMAISADGLSVYAINYSSNTVSMYTRATSVVSGTFTSAVIDTTTTSSFSTVSYVATTPANTSVTVDVRAGNTSSPDGTWTAWQTGLSSGASISSLSGNRYAQYRLNLSNTDGASIPVVSTVSLNYGQYTSSGYLISSPFDSGSTGNIVSHIAWTATTPSGTVVKFQVRTAPDAAGAPGTWSEWVGPDGTSATYFTDSTGAENMPAAFLDASNDQWFQYKAFLTTSSTNAPTLTDTTVTYVVNAPPDFDATFGTNGIIVEQIATSTDANLGKVSIEYKIRDTDTTTGSVTPGFITPSFEYNIGAGWVAITSGNMASSSVTNKAVSEVGYNTYTAYFDAASALPDTYSTSAQIRVKLNDNEGANNITYATSSAFILDTRTPTVTNFHVNGASATSTVSFNVTDDTNIKDYTLSNNVDFTPDGSNASSGIAQVVDNVMLTVAMPWIPTGTSSKIVYLKVQDKRGNIRTSQVSIPATPSNIQYRDISNQETSSYREFIAWNVYPDPAPAGAAFKSYELYYSDNGTDYSLLYTSTNPTINYYIHTPVSTSTLYYYKVAFTTQNDDRTLFSTVVSDIPDGKGGTNNGAVPIITNVAVSDVKNTSAKVTWTTDDLALSEVDYGTSISYGHVQQSRSYVTSHSVYITGLTPNTQYYVRARSIDIYSGTATDNNNGAGYTFTTAGGPVISNVTASSISDGSATISWNTSTSSDSYVAYSTSPSLASYTEVGSATLVDGSAGVYQHRVTVTGLSADTTYYFQVKSTADGNTTIDTNNNSYYSFRTTYDTIAPVITDVLAPVRASTGAVITWKTDELSTTQVEYGTVASTTSGSYESQTVAVTTPSIFHAMTLSSETLKLGGGTNALAKLTAYYYRVKSTDQAGNSSYSAENTFTTTEDGATTITYGSGGAVEAAKPDTKRATISDIDVTDITPFSATISFKTDESTLGIIQYGDAIPYDHNTGGISYASAHKITLSALKTGTTYNYSINVIDTSGNVTQSSNATFKTTNIAENLGNLLKVDTTLNDLTQKVEDLVASALPSINPPFIDTPIVDAIGEDFATVSWKTNVKSYGSILYAEDKTFIQDGKYTGEQTKTDAKITEHTIDLDNLKPNTKYHFKVKSYVFLGAAAQSEDMTFVTKAEKVVARVSDRKKDSMKVLWTTKEPTTSVVNYKKKGSASATKKTDGSMTTSHELLLDNLAPATTYEIQAYGVTVDGNTVDTKDTIIASTNEDVTSPAISNFKVDSALVPGRNDRTQTIVSWKTDEPATSVVRYEEGSGSLTSTLSLVKEDNSTYVTSHVVILTNLKPATVYRFQIISADDANNTTRLPIRTIVTPSQSESVVDVIFKNFDDTFKFMRTVQ
ncbi:MAG: beta-propeller fold lactonase family protein [Candidatus Paceibacterota bacterium]